MKRVNLPPLGTVMVLLIPCILAGLLPGACSVRMEEEVRLVDPAGFDVQLNGKQVELYTLRNSSGCVAQFTNFGGRWISMWVPDQSGRMTDVVLGFNSLNDYLVAGETYHGAIIGRACGRINNANFSLDGTTHHLAHNDGFGKPEKNHLHGGKEGFHRKVWEGSIFENEQGEQGVLFTYGSEDGEEGYPGRLDVRVTYLLSCNNEMQITYEAVASKTTPVNLTNHAYFNLNGEGNGNILGHQMKIYADQYVECNPELIPTGRLRPVEGTPLDYREYKTMGYGISMEHDQIFKELGYASAMVIKEKNSYEMQTVAEAFSERSGIKMEEISDQPSLQIYNAWLFDGGDTGKSKKSYEFSSGFVMETQGFPDAPNHPHFPEIMLQPGETYSHHAIYRFLVKDHF